MSNFKKMTSRSPFLSVRKGVSSSKSKPLHTLVKYEYLHDVQKDILTWTVPYRLDSPNKSINPYKKSSKNKMLRKKLQLYLPKEFDNIPMPCTVTFCRIAPRALDFDNLVYSFKFIRDTIADFFLPGQAAGRADGDKRLTWNYTQEKQKVGEYGIKITIEYGQRPV